MKLNQTYQILVYTHDINLLGRKLYAINKEFSLICIKLNWRKVKCKKIHLYFVNKMSEYSL